MEQPLSEPSQPANPGRNAAGLLWGVGAAAFMLFVVGGVVAIRSTLGPNSSTRGQNNIISAQENPEAVHEHKQPKAFGLPSPPTAFAFELMDGGPGRGSAAFDVKQGSAATVSSYYVEKLGAQGWVFLGQSPKDIRPDEKKPLVFHGLRTEWVNKKLGQHLALTALDDVKPDHRAQVVLSWSPIVLEARPAQ